jgi:hypothetical protein
MLRPTIVALAGAAVAVTGVIGITRRVAHTDRRAATAMHHLSIVASNYAFDAPDTVAAGLTSIDLLNRGPDLHHAWLVRLDEGHTATDYFVALKAGGTPPSWAHDVGGPNAPAPGQRSSAFVNLEPGRYLLVCFVPAADGAPHLMKGMLHQLVVRPAASPSAVSLSPDAELSLRDYDFTFAKPIVAGHRILRVRNDGVQPHEVVVVRINPGHTVEEVAAWAEKPNGPPPGMPIGGTTGLAPGAEDAVALDLQPGEYGLICFLPDARDGRPHLAHGMIKQFRVGS